MSAEMDASPELRQLMEVRADFTPRSSLIPRDEDRDSLCSLRSSVLPLLFWFVYSLIIHVACIWAMIVVVKLLMAIVVEINCEPVIDMMVFVGIPHTNSAFSNRTEANPIRPILFFASRFQTCR